MGKEKIKSFINSTFGKVVITVFFMIIIYGALLLCVSTDNPVLIVPIGLACLVFGWKTIGETNPFLMIFASGNFMIFYYIFKIMLSLLIGYFVAPFQLSRMITRYISSR